MTFIPFTSTYKTTPMTRYISLFVFFLFVVTQSVLGQEEFSQLSPKKRISIAENEEKEAIKDQEFQNLMQAGNEYFKQRHYLKAIRKYEKAQERRPYNVYPKVIIADIELSMKDTLATLRAAEKAENDLKDKQRLDKPSQPEEVQPESEADRRKKQEEWERSERARLAREREMQKEKEAEPKPPVQTGDVVQLSIADLQKELGSQYPTGVTEEVTKEGNKTITKRIVVANNLGNEYKKVVHDWGGVFYFKNGEAVTERVWIQETEK